MPERRERNGYTNMKIVDKEQERIDIENKPESKKKQLLEFLAVLVFFLICVGVYKLFPNIEIGAGKPYVIFMDGLEITPGKMTVQDLADAGYELSDMSERIMASDKDENGNTVFFYRDVYDLESDAEARTLYASLVLVKGEHQAADVSIINNSGKSIPLSQCIVSEITIRSNYVDADKVTVDGTPFSQLTEEKITEMFGKQERKSSDTTTVWERGKYYFYFEVEEDGTVKRISTHRYYPTDILEQYQNKG